MQIDKIHRRSDGTIDIDAYRQEAFVLRVQTWRRFFKRLGRVVQSLTDAAFGSFLRLTATFVSDIHENRSIVARYSGHRWCDSTERALSNELMGRRSWSNSD
jgi:hypothetical protein